MKMHANFRSLRMALATATALAAGLATTVPATQVMAEAVSQRATSDITLSKGRGQLINLSESISDVLVSNEKVADVQVRSPRQIYIFAKEDGESTIFATTSGGKVAFSANVRVAGKVNSLDQMLNLAMPEADIKATSINGMVLLTGTVAGPEDGAEAERLVKAFVGDGIQVISRMKTATPLQVNLQVRIVEVSRDVSKSIGFNLLNNDTTGGLLFGIAQGRSVGSINSTPALPPVGTSPGVPGSAAYNLSRLGTGQGINLGFAGRFLGLDVLAALDLAETDGQVTTLAQPNLTALSGETASFLAGGEIPIPALQGTSGAVTVEFKPYGVSLAFTPTVLGDGRISMRVRPEVSQLTSNGSVTLNGFNIPALSTRRTETTVELGSGQSFMISGLMSNTHNNSVDKAPFLGDLPILGALFKSTKYRRNETELMVVVTPYLVKPVSANQLVYPTDGYKASNDDQRFLLGQTFVGDSGAKRPMPTLGAPQTITTPTKADDSQGRRRSKKSSAVDNADGSPAPGFGQ